MGSVSCPSCLARSLNAYHIKLTPPSSANASVAWGPAAPTVVSSGNSAAFVSVMGQHLAVTVAGRLLAVSGTGLGVEHCPDRQVCHGLARADDESRPR